MRAQGIEFHRSLSVRALIIAAFAVLLLLATAYFATMAATPERPEMIPIHWSGDLAV